MSGRPTEAVFLTEAGPAIGLGHAARCVALYDAFERRGVTCTLVLAGAVPAHIVGSRTVVQADWWSVDAAIRQASGADVCIVDSYHADLPTYEAVSATVPVAVFLDDTARLSYPPGIVVNANPDAADLAPFGERGVTPVLGVGYQLLRSEFRLEGPRMQRERIERVLLVSGGMDIGSLLERMRAVVTTALPGAAIDAVDSPRTAAEMREAMLAADVALSAAGQTMYELAATATPTVAVCVADNQRSQVLAFERRGAVAFAGMWGESGTEGEAGRLLRKLASRQERESLAAAARQLVDGAGADRVAARCLERLESQGGDLR